jgi:hypothetical protein
MNDDADAPSSPPATIIADRLPNHHRASVETTGGNRLRAAVVLAASLLSMTALAGTPGPTASDKMLDVGGTILHFRVTAGCSPIA